MKSVIKKFLALIEAFLLAVLFSAGKLIAFIPGILYEFLYMAFITGRSVARDFILSQRR